jgi:hypothetical protein
MARPRKHANNAHRQAAYRRRQRQAIHRQLEAKGLPALPAIPTVPGWSRWKQAMAHAESLVTQVQSEMEGYYDDRSEVWQQDERGDDFQQKLQDLNGVLDAISDWII